MHLNLYPKSCIRISTSTGLLLALLAGCSTPTSTELPHVIHTPAKSGTVNVSVDASKEPRTLSAPATAAFVTDAFVQQTFRKARIWVEAETGTRLNHIKLQIVAGSDIRKEVKRETRRLVQSQFSDDAYAEKFLNRMVNDQASSYAALYTHEGNRVLVNRNLMQTFLRLSDQETIPPEQALLALLVHELVHAADDVKYRIQENRVMSFKVSFTQSAAFEGHAQLVTRQICTQHNCLPGMQALENFMFAPSQTNDPVLQSVQAISRNMLEYSYIEGERFLTQLLQRPNGRALVDGILRNPPEDPIQILVPATFPDNARENRNRQLRNAIQKSGHVWTRQPYRIVETSPIKGINIRNHPERRSAAIEGFTRLITAMESAQIYNQSSGQLTPIDLTLIEAENDDTARMFAESFVQHASDSTGQQQPASVELLIPDLSAPDGLRQGVVMMFSQETSSGESLGNTVMIALLGRHVLQLNGSPDQSAHTWINFTESVFSQIDT